ncbi:MAG: beta-N-acetylhexosaminidase [Mucilaginibacter sp.]|uniref:beta-N-acetylhexosaminidase n=1 Tax=Mucilaginibacter sp. TaxID=1882438 RepID=UPI0031ADEA6E
MKKYFLLIALFAFYNTLNAQNLNLIPYPQQVKQLKTTLRIKPESMFFTKNSQYKNEVLYLNGQLGLAGKGRQEIRIVITKDIEGIGAYRLSTVSNKIAIMAAEREGVFNGVTTLLQLCRSAKAEDSRILPGLIINDKPRYQWRGFMLDESRHFFGMAAVKNILNWMAFYKLNRFHWHLTDAQGWRIEIKKYPWLTKIGGIGNFTDSTAAARYYTQKEIKEIVAYAKRRHIEIVPEIDMPGHATAANKAYPKYSGGKVKGYDDFTFNPGKEETYQFLTNILKELKVLFPDGRIHIGGDEVALGIKAWDNNTDVKKLMEKKGYTDHQQAEAYFLRRIADSVIKLKNKVMCWDEAVAANLPVNHVLVNWWRQNKPEVLQEAITKGYPIILSPRLPMYFDFVQDSTHISGRKWDGHYNTYLDVYHFPENDLTADVYQSKNVIGVQANLWTETVASQKRLDYLLFPRIAAVAESGWTFDATKNDDLFNARLKAHLNYYKNAGIYYFDPFNPSFHKEAVDVAPKPVIKD